MTGTQRSFPGGWRGYALGWAVVACLCGIAPGQVGSAAAWKTASAARSAFEQEPAGQHTRAEYAAVMDDFRAIYHGDPANLYAPRAVAAVADLLAEEGHELKDRKCLRDAAGQYEYLARAYPASSLATPGLGKALLLLGPDEANDAAASGRVRALLDGQFPKSAAALAARDAGAVSGQTVASTDRPILMTGVASSKQQRSVDFTTKVPEAPADTVDSQRRMPGAAPAMVTGIRHWSTATYTRVAIDLGGEVEFQAARVEHPDRIFFDLHGAKLAPGLAGKTFDIVDDGFLKTIRAGQAGADVTRIVLDVQPVAEYSAFLLPNPTRLIIDVHGKAVGQRADESGSPRQAESGKNVNTSGPAPAVRVDPGGLKSTGDQVSSLPPMPVTDGSANFGLPAKRTGTDLRKSEAVARPRVVVSAQPTEARPVPNSVSSPAPRSNRDVAAVSEGPGVIPATGKPSSRPVAEKAKSRGPGTANPAAPVPAAPPTAEGQAP